MRSPAWFTVITSVNTIATINLTVLVLVLKNTTCTVATQRIFPTFWEMIYLSVLASWTRFTYTDIRLLYMSRICLAWFRYRGKLPCTIKNEKKNIYKVQVLTKARHLPKYLAGTEKSATLFASWSLITTFNMQPLC